MKGRVLIIIFLALIASFAIGFISFIMYQPAGFVAMSPQPEDHVQEIAEQDMTALYYMDRELLDAMEHPGDSNDKPADEKLSEMRNRSIKDQFVDLEPDTVDDKELRPPVVMAAAPQKTDMPELPAAPASPAELEPETELETADKPEETAPVTSSIDGADHEETGESEEEEAKRTPDRIFADEMSDRAVGRGRILDALTYDHEPDAIDDDMEEDEIIEESPEIKAEIIEEMKGEIQKFRVRSRFPEILFYHPNLITDDQGRTGFAVQAADAITEYLIRAEASTPRGEWGDSERSFTVFQPFFIDFEPPSKLHKSDKIKTSAIIFNYTQRNISASIEINHSDHVTMESAQTGRITIPVEKSVEFPLVFSVKKTGIASVTITVEGDNIRDSIRRDIQVYPDMPERRLNVAGTLSELDNTLHIDIPDDSIILDNDFRLRIFNDPAMGALAFVREINDKPHANIESAASMLMASATAYSILGQDALLDSDLKHELNRYIDQGWIRLLAFRNHDGFAMYPGGETDSRAALLILESLAKLKSVRVVDSKLEAKLINIAKSVFDNDYDYSWRLYAASMIAENTDLDSRTKRELQNLLNTPEIRNSKDPAVIGLSARLAIALDANSSLDTYINKMDNADKINISMGYANLIRAFVKSNQTADKSDLQRFIDAFHDSAMNSDNKPFDRCYAIMALIDQSGIMETHSGIESVVINGQRVYFSANPYIIEIPVTLNAGGNRIEIKTEFPNHAYQLFGRYFSHSDIQPREMLDYSYRADETHEDIVFAEFRIQNPTILQRARLHIPVPSGFSPIESASELKSKTGSKFVEFRANEVIIYYSDELKTHPVVFEIPFISELRGDFYIAPPFIDADDTSPEIILDTGSRIRLL